MRPVLEVNGLGKTYRSRGSSFEALQDVSFEVAEGEFLSVVGPSGSGKTTLLRTISGLLAPTKGTVTLRGNVVSEPPPGLSMVFQDYRNSLYPWMTVRGNVMLPLKALRLDRREMDRRVAEGLSAVGLAQAVDKKPHELSGGMQQRVAIARALAYQPDLLLMDEPFASVDAQTRLDLEDLVIQATASFKITTIFVTHDIDEAVYLADSVLVLSHTPTVVLDKFLVDLPRPRDQIETKRDPRFIALRSEVFDRIRHR